MGPPTAILFKGARTPSILFLATNLKTPLSIIFKRPQFKWARNNNIDPEGPGPLNLNFPSNLNAPPRNSI